MLKKWGESQDTELSVELCQVSISWGWLGKLRLSDNLAGKSIY